MKPAYKALIAAAVGATAILLMITTILGSSQYLTVSELYKYNPRGETVVVMGRVVNGTIVYHGDRVEFMIYDENSTMKESLRIVYVGMGNINVYDGAIVVAKGEFNGTALIAREVLTKCPSTYEPASGEAQ